MATLRHANEPPVAYARGVRACAALLFMIVLATPAAHAQNRPPEDGALSPEHLAQAFIQYGVAFVGEFVAAPGPICSTPGTSGCILGDGGGLAARIGKRLRSPFYIGGAYEFVKTDSAQLYRIGILQQFRAEGRYYVSTGYTIEPYIMASLGVAVYGNLWGIDTGGPAFGVGIGTEFQLSTYLVVGLTVTYRPMFFAQFHDSSETSTPLPACNVDPSCHPSGFSHLIGIDLVLEPRAPL
jgi:hypothetical protein